MTPGRISAFILFAIAPAQSLALTCAPLSAARLAEQFESVSVVLFTGLSEPAREGSWPRYERMRFDTLRTLKARRHEIDDCRLECRV